MSEKSRFADYKASKTVLFWTAVSAAAVTAIVGFSGLGWVTAATAEKMRQEAVDDVRLEFTTATCLQEFFNSEDPISAQVELKDLQSYKREKQVIENGWVSAELAGSKTVEKKAARACIAEVLKAEIEVFDYELEEVEGEFESDLVEDEAEVEVIEPVAEPAVTEVETVEPSISMPVVTQVPAQ
jgi:hypothetical protein